MIILEYTNYYLQNRKKFLKNNPQRSENMIKTLSIFVQHPIHPSLHLEKLQNGPIWTIRIDKQNRIFFVWKTDNIMFLIDVGKHDKYRQY